jgi:hypothetical protein
MTFEEKKNKKLTALVEAVQDCGHYTDFEDLEKKLEYVDFCKCELLFFAAEEWGLRQAGETAFVNALPGTWHRSGSGSGGTDDAGPEQTP